MIPTPNKTFIIAIQDALYIQLKDEVNLYLENLPEDVLDNTEVFDTYFEFANEHVFNDNLEHLK